MMAGRINDALAAAARTQLAPHIAAPGGSSEKPAPAVLADVGVFNESMLSFHPIPPSQDARPDVLVRKKGRRGTKPKGSLATLVEMARRQVRCRRLFWLAVRGLAF